jgi:antitoxin component YwqK of YwqJK toxin-antitoxin module
MKYKKWVFGGIITFIFLSFFVYSKSESFEITYIKLFKKTLSIIHKNGQGQLEGKATFYKDGNIAQEASFINGLRNGWELTYYKSGHIQRKIFYKNDKEDGEEYGYYENEKLRYQGAWRNGKRFGNLPYYNDAGTLKVYHAYNILGEKFNIVWFDQSGSITKYEGFLVSNIIYSVDNQTGSLVVLTPKHVYSDIKDLYLNVATPPNTVGGAAIKITINGITARNLSIKNNTIQIPNVFDKDGAFKIVIEEQLIDKNNKVLDNSSFTAIVIKKA